MEVIRTYRIGGKCPYCMEEHDVKVLRGEETNNEWCEPVTDEEYYK